MQAVIQTCYEELFLCNGFILYTLTYDAMTEKQDILDFFANDSRYPHDQYDLAGKHSCPGRFRSPAALATRKRWECASAC